MDWTTVNVRLIDRLLFFFFDGKWTEVDRKSTENREQIVSTRDLLWGVDVFFFSFDIQTRPHTQVDTHNTQRSNNEQFSPATNAKK